MTDFITKKRPFFTCVITALCLCVSLFVYLFLNHKDQSEHQNYHQYQQQQTRLNQQILDVQSLDDKIEKSQKVWQRLSHQGFFEKPKSQSLPVFLQQMAQECHIVLTQKTSHSCLEFQQCLWKQSVDLLAQAELDQDVFHFIHKLTSLTKGIILITGLNLFHTFSKGQVWPSVQGDIKFDIYHFYKAL